MSQPASSFSSFLAGNTKALYSESQRKRILLTGQLCIVTCALCVLFILVEFVIGPENSWPFLVACFISSTVSFVLNRMGYYPVARIILGFTVNANIFLVCISEPIQIGIWSFFIVTALGSLAIFGYEEKFKAVFFLVVAIGLFIICVTFDIHLKKPPVYSPEMTKLNILFNFSGSVFGAVMIMNFLINLNHHAEGSLRGGELQMQNKNKELLKLNAELDNFVYSTSHDLRAPLNSMQGLIELTRMTNNEEEIRRYIQMMEGRISNLTKFIGAISDYSRNARLELSYKTTDVKAIVTDIIETLKFYPGYERIKVNLNIPSVEHIVTDPIRLQIILSNLISNAYKYFDSRKEESFLVISSTTESGYFKIIIKDNGIGISNEYLPSIFKMFFQASENAEGSGLGLYIVKEAIDKLSGKIEVASELKKGTSFTVLLPLVGSHS